MFKTIFGKIMMLFMTIIMISLIISGAMMSQMMRDSYLSDSEQQMLRAAEDVKTYVGFYNHGFFTEEDLKANIALRANADQNQIWVVMKDGRVIFAGETDGGGGIDDAEIKKYYDTMLASLKAGDTVRVTTQESNVFNTPVITVAKPIETAGLISEYVFVHKKISALNTSLMAIYRQIVLSIAISAILAIILTYIFTRNMLRPLTVVTTGAKQLARGHFDIWLEVRSQDEIGQLAETFNTVAHDLKKNEETRESFVANVSHELRSPLTSMQGLVQGVIDGTIPENESLHYLGIVLDETKRMNLLVNDLLDLAKIDSGQFPMKTDRIDINEMIRRTLIMFESKIDVKNLMIEVEFAHDKEYVIVDPNRIMQVLQNLIDNAIKFADYSGRLRIATMVTKRCVFVSINNSGEPIPRSVIPYLFDRFYKGDKSHTRTKEGTGIGLSLVKKILEEHRQRVWVESDKIGGTTFTFTLKKPDNSK